MFSCYFMLTNAFNSAAENAIFVFNASVFTAMMVLEQFGVDLKHDIKDKTDNYIN